MLRSAAPSMGRGSRGHSLLPMEGGAPKGRRLDGGSGMKERGDRLKCIVYESVTICDTKHSPQNPSQPIACLVTISYNKEKRTEARQRR